MGEDNKPLEGLSLEDLEKQVKGDGEGGTEVFNLENEEERMVHSDDTVDARVVVANIGFERALFGAGVGLLVVIFMLVFTFFSTLGIGEPTEELLTVTNPEELYSELIEDKDYLFFYDTGSGITAFDPLNSQYDEDPETINLTSATARTNGNFVLVNNDQQVNDGSGQLVMKVEDPARKVSKIISLPSGNGFLFTISPATQEAIESFGLRVGVYEYNIEDEEVYTLVSDALPGEGVPGNDSHNVRILTLSPHARYLSYTNSTKLWLYDRLSGVSIEIADLPSSSTLPDTGWDLRANDTEVKSFQQTFTR